MNSEYDTDMASKKLKSFFNLRVDNNKELLEGLKEVSSFYNENTLEAQRSLKGSIDRQALDCIDEFLHTLKNAHEALNKVYKDVGLMSSTVSEMANRLSSTRFKTKILIEETNNLQGKIRDVQKKQDISSSIIERFQLSPSEVAALRAPNVNLEMLSTLNKAKEIHSRCDLLENVGCRLAENVKDQMTEYQEKGMERLFRWAQARCRSIDQPDPTFLLPLTMEMLQSRPQLFNQIMEEYCTNRRDLLVRQLISALTRGGRPIEHRVTEPKRYVGDMLAWLHQAVPAERDSLSYLLRNCNNSDAVDQVQQALCSITDGVCHPLKVRIEHILLGENNVRDPLLIQSLLSLLRYYHGIIKQVVGGGKLLSSLSELTETAERTLIISLTGRVTVMLGGEFEKPSNADLTLVSGGVNALALLSQIFQADISTPPQVVQKIANCVVDPLMISITESAARMAAVDAAVYLLNAFHSIEVTLALQPFLDERLERLKAASDAQMDTLISEQASSLVAHLGLGAIYTELHQPLPKPLSRHPSFNVAVLSPIAIKLNKLISNPDVYTLPQLALLSNVTRRSEILKKAATVIVSIYSQLFQLVKDPEHEFDDTSIFTHSPEALLQAFNM